MYHNLESEWTWLQSKSPFGRVMTGNRRWFCGRHTWTATAEETGGAFLIFEMILTPAK